MQNNSLLSAREFVFFIGRYRGLSPAEIKLPVMTVSALVTS